MPGQESKKGRKREARPYQFSACTMISTVRLLDSTAQRDPCSRDEVQPYPRVVLIPPNRPGPGHRGSIVAVAWAPSAIQETRDRCHCGSSNSCDRALFPHSSKLRSSGGGVREGLGGLRARDRSGGGGGGGIDKRLEGVESSVDGGLACRKKRPDGDDGDDGSRVKFRQEEEHSGRSRRRYTDKKVTRRDS
jgi:hypothetical protein